MHLRTFIAKDMASALALVRRELGQDAVILHTRTVKRSGILGLFQKPMVEITAADKALVNKYRKQRAGQGQPATQSSTNKNTARDRTGTGSRDAYHRPQQAASAGLHTDELPAETTSGVKAVPTATAGDLIRKTYAAALIELQKQNAAPAPQAAANIAAPHATTKAPSPHVHNARRVTASPSAPPSVTTSAPATTSPLAAASASATAKTQTMSPSISGAAVSQETPMVLPIAATQEQLTQEMRTVQRLVGRLIRRQQSTQVASDAGELFAQRKSVPGELPDALMDQYLAMMKQEVAEEIAEEVLAEVTRKLPGSAIEDSGKVRSAVLDAMAKMIPVDPLPMSFAQVGDGRLRVIALVGPTGVGKTTTVAKLAANLKLRLKKNIGLVTIDTYRIAAVEQLRTYAQIIGVPLEVASNPVEVTEALSRCRSRGCEVVLMDTAGRSQRDDPKLEQLALMLKAAQPDEVHLVLSSTCTQSVLEQAMERFSRLRTDRIIFTKLDEAVSFGVLLNVSKKLNKRLSFVTTGQEVPHDIEPGRAQRLAALVLGEGA